jgi:hypothetical protein
MLRVLFVVAACVACPTEFESADSLKVALRDRNNTRAFDAAIRGLPRVAASDLRVQEEVLESLMDESRETFLPAKFAKDLAGFDGRFALGLASRLSTAHANDGAVICLLTLACMKEKAPRQTTALLEDVLRNSPVRMAGQIRMVLSLYGYNTDENIRWIVQQIRSHTPAGEGALEIASFTGIGKSTQSEPLRKTIRDGIADPGASWYAAEAAVILAVGGSKEPAVLAHLKRLYEKARTATEAGDCDSRPLYFAYALSIMDGSHALDYWRFISLKIGGNYNHTDVPAMDVMGYSMSDSACALIAALVKDADPVASKGAKTISACLRLPACGIVGVGSENDSISKRGSQWGLRRKTLLNLATVQRVVRQRRGGTDGR